MSITAITRSTVLPTTTRLEIHKMHDGGFLVIDGMEAWGGQPRQMRFACTTIDEALRYIKKTLEPKQEK